MSLSINPVNWSPDTKKNVSTVGILAIAGGGAKYINTATKNKTYAWNQAINNPLKKFVKSETKFFGSDMLKDIAGKIAKTSSRQKLIGALVVGTLGTVMGLREHFSKEKGKEIPKKLDNKFIKAQDKQIDIRGNEIRTKDKQIEAQNNEIANLEARLAIADSEIKSYKQTLEDIDKAAEKLGVEKDLAKELLKENS